MGPNLGSNGVVDDFDDGGRLAESRHCWTEVIESGRGALRSACRVEVT